MHLSADPKHRNYYRRFFDEVRVVLDGNELKECVEADDRVGFAVVTVLGADGFLVHDSERIVTKRVVGKVEFIDCKTAAETL